MILQNIFYDVLYCKVFLDMYYHKLKYNIYVRGLCYFKGGGTRIPNFFDLVLELYSLYKNISTYCSDI